MVNDLLLDRAFSACAHPIRRGILERLASGDELTVGEATGGFDVSKPAISRHLRVLEEAGAISRVIDGRTHRIRIEEDALVAVGGWLEHQRELWAHKFDVVEDFLAEQRRARKGRA